MTTPGLGQEEGFEVLSPPLRMIICLHSTHLLRTLWAELQGKAAAKGQGMNAVVHVSAGEGTGGIKGWQAKLTQRLFIIPTHHQTHLPHTWEACKGMPDDLASTEAAHHSAYVSFSNCVFSPQVFREHQTRSLTVGAI